SLSYLSSFLADFDYVSDLAFQIGLHADKNVSRVVDRHALHILQLTAKRRDRFQLFTGRVDVKFSVVAVGDVERSAREVNRFGRKRILSIDNPVQLAISIEQVKY